jgi:hypothetical protein
LLLDILGGELAISFPIIRLPEGQGFRLTSPDRITRHKADIQIFDKDKAALNLKHGGNA